MFAHKAIPIGMVTRSHTDVIRRKVDERGTKTSQRNLSDGRIEWKFEWEFGMYLSGNWYLFEWKDWNGSWYVFGGLRMCVLFALLVVGKKVIGMPLVNGTMILALLFFMYIFILS